MIRKLSRAEAKAELERVQLALGTSMHHRCLDQLLDMLEKTNLTLAYEENSLLTPGKATVMPERPRTIKPVEPR